MGRGGKLAAVTAVIFLVGLFSTLSPDVWSNLYLRIGQLGSGVPSSLSQAIIGQLSSAATSGVSKATAPTYSYRNATLSFNNSKRPGAPTIESQAVTYSAPPRNVTHSLGEAFAGRPSSNTVGMSRAANNTAAREAAMSHLNALKELYKHPRQKFQFPIKYKWGMKGITWLYEQQGILLSGSLESVPSGGHALRFQNVLGSPCTARRLLIWVRVTGREVHAGSADPHPSRCEWWFQFKPAVPGTYQLEAKVVTWDGGADMNFTDCNMKRAERGNATLTKGMVQVAAHLEFAPFRWQRMPTAPFPDFEDNHVDMWGFKLYQPQLTCCELCSRMPHCKYWVTPSPSGGEGCRFLGDTERARFSGHLLSEDDGMVKHFRSKLGTWKPIPEESIKRVVVGTPRKERARYFLGCGWDFVGSSHFPCVDQARDDMIHLSQSVVNVSGSSTAEQALLETWRAHGKRGSLPLCKPGSGGEGRWVEMPSSVEEKCRKQTWAPAHYADEAHAELPIALQSSEDEGICWMREDISKIRGPNEVFAPSTWPSSALKSKAKPYFKLYWAPHSCRIAWLSEKQLQRCVNKEKITGVSVEGDSIAKFFKEYVLARGINIKYHQGPGGKKVHVDSLQLIHAAWELSYADMESFVAQRAKQQKKDLNFFMNGQFLSSEREPNVVVDRMIMASSVARRVLAPLGWTEIDWFIPSASFTYDTATANDGMHIIGPPMKLVWNALWTYICGHGLEE